MLTRGTSTLLLVGEGDPSQGDEPPTELPPWPAVLLGGDCDCGGYWLPLPFELFGMTGALLVLLVNCGTAEGSGVLDLDLSSPY